MKWKSIASLLLMVAVLGCAVACRKQLWDQKTEAMPRFALTDTTRGPMPQTDLQALKLRSPDLGGITVRKVSYDRISHTCKICIRAHWGVFETLPTGISFSVADAEMPDYDFYYESIFHKTYLSFFLYDVPEEAFPLTVSYEGNRCIAQLP